MGLPAHLSPVHADRVFEVVDKIGRNLIRADKYEWKAELGHGQYYKELAQLPGLDRWVRIREVARLNTIHLNARKRRASLALWLIKIVRKATDNPVDCLSQAYLESIIAGENQASQPETDIMPVETLYQCTDRFFENRANDQFLTEWAQAWNVSPDFQLALARF